MKTVDEVFELIEIREDASDAVLSWRIGPAWKLTEAEKVYVEATKNLRTAIEELHRDASKWLEYKARKDAVIAAGMGRNPMRDTATCDTYGVINEDGKVEYSASWPEACHDHIKDMQIEHGIGGKWKVRALKYLPVTTPRKESI